MRVRVGTSGWRYPSWRGSFYPKGLRQKDELAYTSALLATVELNGSFYSLQRPESYRRWHAETPPGFVFAVKGSRFITHMKKLRDVETALANFLASGVLALEEKLGPFLWQLPPDLPFDAERLEAFLALLPRTTGEAARLARRHDTRLAGRAWTRCRTERPLRHAFELRHASFFAPAPLGLLRRHRAALVFADTARRFPYAEDLTSNFVYLRLHGAEELYVSGYTAAELDGWAARIRAWSAGGEPADARRVLAHPARPRAGGRDVYVYFDNTANVCAAYDARELSVRLAR